MNYDKIWNDANRPVESVPEKPSKVEYRVDALWEPGNYAKSFWFDTLVEADAWIAARTANQTWPWPDNSDGDLMGPYRVEVVGGRIQTRQAHEFIASPQEREANRGRFARMLQDALEAKKQLP